MMMKNFCFLVILSLIVGCSSGQRAPSSLRSEDPCFLGISSLIDPSFGRQLESISAESLEKRGLVTAQDLDRVYGDELFKREILDLEGQESEEKSAQILVLLQKRHPDFNSEKIVQKYKILFQFCGL